MAICLIRVLRRWDIPDPHHPFPRLSSGNPTTVDIVRLIRNQSVVFPAEGLNYEADADRALSISSC